MGKMYKKEGRGSFVTGNDPKVGRDSLAGLPKDAVMKQYPRNAPGAMGYLDDSMDGIDEVQNYAAADVKSNMSNQK